MILCGRLSRLFLAPFLALILCGFAMSSLVQASSSLPQASSSLPQASFLPQEYSHWAQNAQSEAGLQVLRALGSPVAFCDSHRDLTTLSEDLRSLLGMQDISENLRFECQSQHLVGTKDYLRYVETWRGIPLDGTFVELRLSQGRLLMIRAEFAADVPSLLTLPVFAEGPVPALLEQLEAEGFEDEGEWQALFTSQESGEWHAVLRGTIMRSHPLARQSIDLSPDGARILKRKNILEALYGSVRGHIQELTPWGPNRDRPFSDLRVRVGDEIVITDTEGFFEADISEEEEIRVEFRANYLRVTNEGGPNSEINVMAQNDDEVNVFFDTSNSQRAERNTLYHARQARIYLGDVEPSFTGLNFVTTFHVRDTSDHCNGYWAGDDIYLFAAGEGCADYGEIADVIVHEYGHGLSYAQYGAAYPNGSATAEAMSDIFAAYVLDSSLMGAGAYGPGTFGRNLNNDLVWPEDLVGQIHMDGRILGGAFWDLREALGSPTADHLFHFCKYGHPVNFDDFLLEVLLVDDDDDDLSNGTPNGVVIHDCFGRHGIGSGMLPSLEHAPLGDTMNSQTDYRVFVRTMPSAFGLVTDSLLLHQRDDDMWTSTPFELYTSPDLWMAEIPAVPAGSLVRYYISVVDSIGQGLTLPSAAGEHPYFFLVGQPLLAFNDNFESDLGWLGSDESDDATSGLWEQGIPVGSWVGDRPIQPGSDHSSTGMNCWFTGNAAEGAPAGSNDVDNGCTSLISPSIYVGNLEHPVLMYYRWWVDDTFQDDGLHVSLSQTDGESWVPLETVEGTENSWVQKRWLIEEFLENPQTIRLKFQACDIGAGSLVEAAIDDVWVFAPDTLETDLSDHFQVPKAFHMGAPYPNPSNGDTWVSIELNQASRVVFRLYNVLGEELSMTEDYYSAGQHRYRLPTTALSTGIFFLHVRSDQAQQTQKLLRIK